MKTIQYECRPGQLCSTIYQVLVFINEDNKALLERISELTYDPEFDDCDKYQFYPVLLRIKMCLWLVSSNMLMILIV